MSLKVEVHAADAGACGWYRLGWPAAAVEAGGLAEVDVQMPSTDNEPYLPTYWDGTNVIGLRKRKWPDVLVIQRPLKRALAQVIPLLQAEGVAVVVELDDDFEAVPRRSNAWHPGLAAKVKALFAACAAADLVTTSTPALAEKYAPHGRAVVLPNYVPAWYLSAEREEYEGVCVGWGGSITVHRDDLPVVGNGLATALRGRDDTRVIAVGNGDGVARGLGVARVEPTGWLSLSDYARAVSTLDIGLAPLEQTVFNQSKSWLKPLEYAALGVPAIGSPTREYRRFSELHSDAICLVDHPVQWRNAIKELLDPEARVERSRRARQAVLGATIEAHRGDWSDAWQQAKTNHTKGHS